MATDSEKDPGAVFRDMVTQWERNFDRLANQLMGTEGYTRAMNQLQQSQLMAQKAFADFMTQQLAAMNMPSREDVVRVGEAVRGLDRRLERIERLLQDKAPPAAGQRKGPPRTRKPPPAASGS